MILIFGVFCVTEMAEISLGEIIAFSIPFVYDLYMRGVKEKDDGI